MLSKNASAFICKPLTKYFQNHFMAMTSSLGATATKQKNWQQRSRFRLEEGTRSDRNWLWNLFIGQSIAQLAANVLELQMLSEHGRVCLWVCHWLLPCTHSRVGGVFPVSTSAQQHQRCHLAVDSPVPRPSLSPEHQTLLIWALF